MHNLLVKHRRSTFRDIIFLPKASQRERRLKPDSVSLLSKSFPSRLVKFFFTPRQVFLYASLSAITFGYLLGRASINPVASIAYEKTVKKVARDLLGARTSSSALSAKREAPLPAGCTYRSIG